VTEQIAGIAKIAKIGESLSWTFEGSKIQANPESLASFTKLVEAFGEVQKRNPESIADIGHVDKINAAVAQFIFADEALGAA